MNEKEVRYSSPEELESEIIEINRYECANSKLPSEPHGILKPELLKSVCAKPTQGYESHYHVISNITASIAKNHIFEQANKRTAFNTHLMMIHPHFPEELSTADLERLKYNITLIAEHDTWDPEYFFRLLIGVQ